MKYFAVITILTITIVIQSCQEAPLSKAGLPDFWSEHHETVWDSTSTTTKLLGTWKLTHTYCCPESTNPTGLVSRAEENYLIAISADKIAVLVDNELIQESDWSLQIEDLTLFGLETTPSISYTRGRILFAGNRVLFNNSYIDGQDSYYQKLDER